MCLIFNDCSFWCDKVYFVILPGAIRRSWWSDRSLDKFPRRFWPVRCPIRLKSSQDAGNYDLSWKGWLQVLGWDSTPVSLFSIAHSVVRMAVIIVAIGSNAPSCDEFFRNCMLIMVRSLWVTSFFHLLEHPSTTNAICYLRSCARHADPIFNRT